MATIRVAAVQAEPVWLDVDATAEKTIRLIEEAAGKGAQLVAFPETWIPGYPVFLWTLPAPAQIGFVGRYHANSLTADHPAFTRIREAARDNRIIVVLGHSEKAHGTLYMAQTVVGADGSILLHRRKLKPTHVERTLFGESDGSGIKVVDTPLGRIGALNCWEHLQPLTKYAMYAQNEQIHIASWPCFGVMNDIPALSADTNVGAVSLTYALEGSSFVIVSSQIMSDEGARTFALPDGSLPPIYNGGGGYARVYGPDSSLLTAALPPDQEGIVCADIDLADIDLAKNAADPAGHYARPDVTRLLFDPAPKRPVAGPGSYGTEVAFPDLEEVREGVEAL